jgi:hypothetical protein
MEMTWARCRSAATRAIMIASDRASGSPPGATSARVSDPTSRKVIGTLVSCWFVVRRRSHRPARLVEAGEDVADPVDAVPVAIGQVPQAPADQNGERKSQRADSDDDPAPKPALRLLGRGRVVLLGRSLLHRPRHDTPFLNRHWLSSRKVRTRCPGSRPSAEKAPIRAMSNHSPESVEALWRPGEVPCAGGHTRSGTLSP